MERYDKVNLIIQSIDFFQMGELVKIGYGIYAKSYISEYMNKPVIKGGFDQACKEALTRLEIKWEPGSAEKAYNAGQSTKLIQKGNQILLKIFSIGVRK
jgi:hypothetical protein